ncbi:ComEC/Rec2 family competence protein [Gemmatimonas sp.]|uniref:ComEC/Rec2 family competence protein n=1 Tax=Gemmatimonas sp. TaxID=1962908 RepID=UPI003562462B
MKRLACGLLAMLMLTGASTPAANTLDIYFIDVEGGQATLMITPAGESFLIDAGFPGDGTFASQPGPPALARDAQRILAVARMAGVRQIDHLMVTHYHADHMGGVIELSQLLPILHFIDHAAPSAEAEVIVPGTIALYDAYVTLRATGKHTEPKPGDRLPLAGVDVVVLASAGEILATPLPGAGQPNPACTGSGEPAQEKTENPRSTAIRVQFGAFRFLNVGDLSGAPLFALTCPTNLIGESDVYLVAHHGGNDGADPSLFAAVRPRVAIMNNAPRKGGQARTFATIRSMPTIDGWQLHRSGSPTVENFPDARVANLDESTSAWIKVSASANGSFTVTNGRTGQSIAYPQQ